VIKQNQLLDEVKIFIQPLQRKTFIGNFNFKFLLFFFIKQEVQSG